MLPIAREFQRIFIVGTLALILLQAWWETFFILPWLAWLVFAFMVRDFNRDVPPNPLATISPVDGIVSAIEIHNDPFLNRPSLRYTLRQYALGEFNLHSPTEGKIEQLWVRDPIERKKALAFWLITDEKDNVVVHVELNSFIQHASTTLHPGERVGQGRRCGFVAPGCKVHIYLPENIKKVAKVGDKMVAGRSIISNYIH
jgi:phosphatidylserine decarboxylase